MKILKVLEVGINIQNCIGIYADEDNIRQILVDRYEGRCFKGCFIKTVEKILKTGRCMINQDGDPSFGTISVIFEATVIMYVNGEIINGCVVKNRDARGVLVCNTEYASIMVSPHDLLVSVVKDQIISVRVGATRYNGSSNKISIGAVLYLPNQETIIYKMNGILSEPVKATLTNVLERIQYEEDEMEKLRGKAWEVFDGLLYAYKEPQKQPAVTLMNIKDIAKTGFKSTNYYISRDPKIHPSTPSVYVYTSIPESANASTIKIVEELSASNVILILLEDYCSHLRTIREMVEIYNTEKLINDHKNLWSIYKKNKL